jgi:SprT-like family
MSIAPYDTKVIPTAEYDSFERAFDYFNAELFGGRLPLCLITLNRNPRTRGYFSPERFQSRLEEERTDEIALNPDGFEGRTDKSILSTLVHEMVHLWQQHFGEPSRSRYHNKEWAGFMEGVGLMPSTTGEPGGKRTGQSVTHYIIEGGPFDQAAERLLGGGFALTWQSRRNGGSDGKSKKDKVKYTCPGCGVNAWGKPDLHLICGDCTQRMESEEDTPSEPPATQLVPTDPAEQIRARLAGLKGKAYGDAAMAIADEELGEGLDLFGLTFDYDGTCWLFMDENDIVVDEGEAATWADAIVKARVALRAALQASGSDA